MGKENLIKKFYRHREDLRIDEEPFECNILSIMACQIKDYIEMEGNNYNQKLPAIFYDIATGPQLLSDLLAEDFEYLMNINPDLRYLKDKVHFTCSTDEFPYPAVITSVSGEYLVVFNRRILDLLHFLIAAKELFYNKAYYSGKYKKFENDPFYGDLNLMWLLLKKVSFLYNKTENVSLNIPFYFEPFDYCERVIAARRFMLAHEIAHIHLQHENIPKEANGDFLNKKLDYNSYSKLCEVDADDYAIETLFNAFNKAAQLSDIEVCNIENHIAGIIPIFFFLDLCEGFHNWYNYTGNYPRAIIREVNCINVIGASIKRFTDRIPFLGSYQLVTAFENEILKRLPFHIIYLKIGDIAGSLGLEAVTSGDNVYIESNHSLDRQVKDLLLFLGNYVPYRKEKLKQLEIFEVEMIHRYYKHLFGEKPAKEVITNMLSGATRRLEYDRIEWDLLMVRRKLFINFLKELREMINHIDIEILAPADQNMEKLFAGEYNIGVTINEKSNNNGFAGVDGKMLIEITLTITGNIALGIISNYIYDKCKGRVDKLWIRSKKVEINEEAITQALAGDDSSDVRQKKD